MKSTRARFIGVGILVCIFAIGMATFLNYFKYKSTLSGIVKARLLVIGYGIENSVQSALGLGMSFAEIGTLDPLIAREKSADPMISGIDVFDPAGRILYSTAQDRVGKNAPQEWLAVLPGVQAKEREWFVSLGREPVTGIALKNNFDLTVGYLAIRYPSEAIEKNVRATGMRLLRIAAVATVVVSVVIALVLIVVLRGYERDMAAIEARVTGQSPAGHVPAAFAPAVEALRESLVGAENEVAGAGIGAPSARPG